MSEFWHLSPLLFPLSVLLLSISLSLCPIPCRSLTPSIVSSFLPLISLLVSLRPGHPAFIHRGPRPGRARTRHQNSRWWWRARRAAGRPFPRGAPRCPGPQHPEPAARLRSPGWAPCAPGSKSCTSPPARAARPHSCQPPSRGLRGQERTSAGGDTTLHCSTHPRPARTPEVSPNLGTKSHPRLAPLALGFQILALT